MKITEIFGVTILMVLLSDMSAVMGDTEEEEDRAIRASYDNLNTIINVMSSFCQDDNWPPEVKVKCPKLNQSADQMVSAFGDKDRNDLIWEDGLGLNFDKYKALVKETSSICQKDVQTCQGKMTCATFHFLSWLLKGPQDGDGVIFSADNFTTFTYQYLHRYNSFRGRTYLSPREEEDCLIMTHCVWTGKGVDCPIFVTSDRRQFVYVALVVILLCGLTFGHVLAPV